MGNHPASQLSPNGAHSLDRRSHHPGREDGAGCYLLLRPACRNKPPVLTSCPSQGEGGVLWRVKIIRVVGMTRGIVPPLTGGFGASEDAGNC